MREGLREGKRGRWGGRGGEREAGREAIVSNNQDELCAPTVGLEPTTTRLRALRSAD